MLNSEFDSEKNKGRHEEHCKIHNKEEKQLIYNKWKLVMQDLRREIHFFDFFDNYYPKFKKLNTVTKSKWTKHDKTSVESSHPPKECILINVGKDEEQTYQMITQPPTKDEECGSNTRRGSNAYKNKTIYIYRKRDSERFFLSFFFEKIFLEISKML